MSQNYVVLQERVAIFADTELSVLTQGGPAYLVRGATFLGQPTSKNQTIHLADGRGFVPADAVAPCRRYGVHAPTRVLEDHRPDAPQALGGSAMKRPGEQFEAALIVPGWLWLLSGEGYIPESATYSVGSTPQIGQQVHEVQPGDSLSTISERYYGTQARAMDIYNLLANRELIGPDPSMIQPGMRLIIP